MSRRAARLDVVERAAVRRVIKSEGITGQLLAVLVIDEPSFIC